MNINNDAMLDIKIAAYTAEANGKISADQRDFILEYVDEIYENIVMYGDSYGAERSAEERILNKPRKGWFMNKNLPGDHWNATKNMSDGEYWAYRNERELERKMNASKAKGLEKIKRRVDNKICYGKAKAEEIKNKIQLNAEERKKRREELTELRKLQKKQPKTQQDKNRIALLSRNLGVVAECVQEFFEDTNVMDLIERAYTLNDDERENAGILYPMTECFFAKDDDGYYCYTTEGRSFSYSDIDSIPLETVKILMSL